MDTNRSFVDEIVTRPVNEIVDNLV